MNHITLNRFLVFVLLVLFRTSADAAVLKNRYTFDVDANDQVGTAHGTLLGNALIQDGALVLSGTNASMQLPGTLLTNYTSLTLEIWYADTPVNLTNAQLFHFSGGGQLYYALSGGAYFRAGSSSSITKPSTPPVALGGTNHLIWCLDGNTHLAKLYVNGVLVDSNMNCTNNPTMMGAIITSRIGGINGSYFRGRILEFRVYEGAVSDLDAACLEALGPDRTPVDPGVLEDLHIPEIGIYASNTIFGIHVLADFAGMTNVDISTQPEMTLYSDDTNVAVITPERKLKTIAVGTAKITAAYLGLSNSISFTVGTPRDFYLAHRYSFNEVTNDWILHDSVGSANGRVPFNPFPSPPNVVFTGNGELRVSGGYASLPAGIVSSLDEVTIEAWFVWQTNIYRWQRIFDFGNSDVGTYIYATPASGDYNVVQVAIARIGVGAEIRLRGSEPIALNTNSFVAWVYSPVRRLSRLYVNGAPVASSEGKYALFPLSSIVDTNNWLGRSQFSWDGPFYGRYNEFRIFRGALSDSEIQAEFAAGPDVIGADYVLRCQQDGDSIRISWGSSAGTSVLESSSTLDPTAHWNQVLQTPILANGRCSVTIPLSPDSTFFRLRNP